MNFLLESILTLKYRLLVSALLGLLSGILNGTIVFLINHPHKYYFSFSSKNLFFIAIVSSCILMVVSQSWLIKLSQSVIYKLCKSICERVLSAKLSNFEQLGKAKIYAVLSRDLNMLSSALLVFPQLLINFSIVFFCSVYVGFFSLQVLLQVFILLLISIIFFYIFDLLFVKKKFEKVREHTDDLYKSYQGMLEGFKELKLNNPKSKAFQENYLFRAAKAIEKTNGSALFRYTLAQSLWDNLFYFFIGILAFLELYSHKSSIITIKIIIILLFMAAPLKVIILILPQIRQYIVSIQKIASLNIKPEVGKRFKTDSSLLLDKITFNKIGYKYDNFEIGPIDLTLVPGQITYITGKNGSGKSTLAKLIAGLYTPTQGKIFINGCLLTENWLFQYRHNVSAIFTDFYLFDEIPIDLTSSQAREFLSLLGLENKLNLQSNYVNSSVLSTGQRKRLALLYAYLENKKIIILDEWASDQDQQYKEVFYCSIIPRLKKLGKIIVVITHDDRFFHMADQLINLH